MKAKDNPFGSEHVTSLPFVFASGAEAAWKRLEAQNWRGAIVGPCGTGKTTLLEATEQHLISCGFHVAFWRLSVPHPKLPRETWQHAPSTADALLVDGVEQLRLWDWHRLRHYARHAGAFVITSHRPTSLPLWLETTTSPALLQQLVRDLGVTLDDEGAQALWRKHRGNLRLALWQLYDEYAAGDINFKISS